jgi:hypothetical protein
MQSSPVKHGEPPWDPVLSRGRRVARLVMAQIPWASGRCRSRENRRPAPPRAGRARLVWLALWGIHGGFLKYLNHSFLYDFPLIMNEHLK